MLKTRRNWTPASLETMNPHFKHMEMKQRAVPGGTRSLRRSRDRPWPGLRLHGLNSPLGSPGMAASLSPLSAAIPDPPAPPRPHRLPLPTVATYRPADPRVDTDTPSISWCGRFRLTVIQSMFWYRNWGSFLVPSPCNFPPLRTSAL